MLNSKKIYIWTDFLRTKHQKVIFSKKNDDNSRPRSPTHAILGAKESSCLSGLNNQLDFNKFTVETLKATFA